MSSPLPQTMKTWIVARNGPPATALHLKTDAPGPSAPTGANVLVKVHYASLNPVDIQMMLQVPAWIPGRRQPTPGCDYAGEVVAVGPTVTRFKPGALVAGMLNAGAIASGRGTLAEYVTVPEGIVSAKPEGLSLREAAGLFGIVGLTTGVILKGIGCKAGDRVLVLGASGGVGSTVVQAAKGMGAFVVGVCSGANEEMVKRLGADEVVDYTKHDPLEKFLAEKYGKANFNAIVDTAGLQAVFSASPAYLDKKGIFYNIVGGKSAGIGAILRNNLVPVFLGGTPRSYKMGGLSGPTAELVGQAAKWASDGWVREVPIDSEWEMADLVKAYEKLATHRAKGKIIVKIAE